MHTGVMVWWVRVQNNKHYLRHCQIIGETAPHRQNTSSYELNQNITHLFL